MADSTMAVPQSTLESIVLSHARVAAMMELTPEQLRLVADWLTAEASEPNGAATIYPEHSSLALRSLTTTLLEFAHFKEGQLGISIGADCLERPTADDTENVC
jgi:hypothetical protein